MENSYGGLNGYGSSNGHMHIPSTTTRHSPRLSWLDIRVFYVRFNKCKIDDDSMPEHLALSHMPMDPSTLLELNGVRSTSSDGVSTLLRRDRLDKKSEEVTFVTTHSVKLAGSVKFKVFYRDDVLLLSGVLGVCDSNSNGFRIGDNDAMDNYNNNDARIWSLSCETDLVSAGFLKESAMIEVYVAGSFLGNPIILTMNVRVGSRNKSPSGGILNFIAEDEEEAATQGAEKDAPAAPSTLGLQMTEYPEYKPELDRYSSDGFYQGNREVLEGEDEELSWFNAGVRVGVGIGLSICLGVGIGVGLLVKTYQGATRGFRRRPL